MSCELIPESFRFRGESWRAYLYNGPKRLRLGTFSSPEDAARAYDAKAAEVFGDFARLNFGGVA